MCIWGEQDLWDACFHFHISADAITAPLSVDSTYEESNEAKLYVQFFRKNTPIQSNFCCGVL